MAEWSHSGATSLLPVLLLLCSSFTSRDHTRPSYGPAMAQLWPSYAPPSPYSHTRLLDKSLTNLFVIKRLGVSRYNLISEVTGKNRTVKLFSDYLGLAHSLQATSPPDLTEILFNLESAAGREMIKFQRQLTSQFMRRIVRSK